MRHPSNQPIRAPNPKAPAFSNSNPKPSPRKRDKQRLKLRKKVKISLEMPYQTVPRCSLTPLCRWALSLEQLRSEARLWHLNQLRLPQKTRMSNNNAPIEKYSLPKKLTSAQKSRRNRSKLSQLPRLPCRLKVNLQPALQREWISPWTERAPNRLSMRSSLSKKSQLYKK